MITPLGSFDFFIGLWADLLTALASLQPAVASPQGECLLAALGLLLLYLMQRTPARWLAYRLLWLSLTLAATLWLVLAGLRCLGEKPGLPLTLLAGALAIWCVGKVLLANHFAGLRDARYPARQPLGADGERLAPLPSQQRLLDELIAWVGATTGPQGMGLEGRWGSGKSWIADHLLDLLNRRVPGAASLPVPVVAVRVNIWEGQSFDDLQWRLLQALYAHPESLRAHGWLLFPLWLLLLTWVRIGLGKLRLSLFGGTVSGDGILELPWQDNLETAVGRLVRRGFRVVYLLDEADRAEPRVVQATFTLIHRSLQLPGVLVVLPFVQQQIRDRAFNPFLIESEDLRSTALTWFNKHANSLRSDANMAAPGAPRFDPLADLRPGGLPAPQQPVDAIFRRYAVLWHDRPHLHEEYYRAMENKFLRLRRLVPALTAADVIALLKQPTQQLAFLNRYGSGDWELLEEWVNEYFDDTPGNARVTIRTLLGEWRWMLDRVSVVADPGDNPTAVECLILALAKARQE